MAMVFFSSMFLLHVLWQRREREWRRSSVDASTICPLPRTSLWTWAHGAKNTNRPRDALTQITVLIRDEGEEETQDQRFAWVRAAVMIVFTQSSWVFPQRSLGQSGSEKEHLLILLRDGGISIMWDDKYLWTQQINELQLQATGLSYLSDANSEQPLLVHFH